MLVAAIAGVLVAEGVGVLVAEGAGVLVVSTEVVAGAVVVVGAAVVVATGVVVTGATVLAPLLHAEATNRKVKATAYFLMALSLSLFLHSCKTVSNSSLQSQHVQIASFIYKDYQ